MYPNNRFGFVFLLIGIIMFCIGIVTDASAKAYVEYNKTKKGIPPRVQKLRLMVGGTLLIAIGLLILFNIL